MCTMNKNKLSFIAQWDANICSLNSQGIKYLQKNSHKVLFFAKTLSMGQKVPAQFIAGAYARISGKRCYMVAKLYSSLGLHYC